MAARRSDSRCGKASLWDSGLRRIIHTTHAGHPPRPPVPRISIVTVCLNDLCGLRDTFESVRAQTAPPAQWIVADGASSDGTQNWLGSIEWPQLSWSTGKDRGIYQGMNKGLQQVDADYVLFMNSGDVFCAPDVLESVTKYLNGAHRRPPCSMATASKWTLRAAPTYGAPGQRGGCGSECRRPTRRCISGRMPWRTASRRATDGPATTMPSPGCTWLDAGRISSTCPSPVPLPSRWPHRPVSPGIPSGEPRDS